MNTTIPNLDRDTSGIAFLKQTALADLGFYSGRIDNWWGTKSEEAYTAFLASLIQPAAADAGAETAVASVEVHRVKASSFADPGDVEAFLRCKARGGSDQECFKVGDNGIGKWGDATTSDRPMCALPPEDWEAFGKAARGKRVLVKANGREVVCELRDTMPHRANITNGAGIDLNPAACAALGSKPPMLISATWQWA